MLQVQNRTGFGHFDSGLECKIMNTLNDEYFTTTYKPTYHNDTKANGNSAYLCMNHFILEKTTFPCFTSEKLLHLHVII